MDDNQTVQIQGVASIGLVEKDSAKIEALLLPLLEAPYTKLDLVILKELSENQSDTALPFLIELLKSEKTKQRYLGLRYLMHFKPKFSISYNYWLNYCCRFSYSGYYCRCFKNRTNWRK